MSDNLVIDNNELNQLLHNNEDVIESLDVEKKSAVRSNFNSIKHNGKFTINKYGVDYRKKRKMKNKVAKRSRKRNK